MFGGFGQELEVLVPREFILDDGSFTVISEDEARRAPPNHVFELWVPRDKVELVASALREHGFRDERLTVPLGERLSLTLKVTDLWEVHVRIFDDGSIVPEVEVSREYIEHLGPIRAPVIYDVYLLYRRVYPKLHLRYRPANKFVVKVLNHYKLLLKPPTTRTPWIPVVAGVAGFAVGLLVGLAITRDLGKVQ